MKTEHDKTQATEERCTCEACQRARGTYREVDVGKLPNLTREQCEKLFKLIKEITQLPDGTPHPFLLLVDSAEQVEVISNTTLSGQVNMVKAINHAALAAILGGRAQELIPTPSPSKGKIN